MRVAPTTVLPHMSVPAPKFHLILGFLFSALACRHENVVGEVLVERRAHCSASANGSVVSNFEDGTPTLLPIDGRSGTWSLATNSGQGGAGLTMEVVADPSSPSGGRVLWVHGPAAN